MKISITALTACLATGTLLHADEPYKHLPPTASSPTSSTLTTAGEAVLRPVKSVSQSTQQLPPLNFAPECSAVERPLTEAELFALDIARRSVLAHYPKAGSNLIRTLEVRVRPQGDIVHTYARISWTECTKNPRKFYESEVFASLVYTPDIRRIYDISYKDNRLKPWRMFNRKIDLVSKLNEDLERRDPLRMASPLVGNRPDVLVPRKQSWINHRLRGDHAWHATSADDYVSPRWRHLESPTPPR